MEGSLSKVTGIDHGSDVQGTVKRQGENPLLDASEILGFDTTGYTVTARAEFFRATVNFNGDAAKVTGYVDVNIPPRDLPGLRIPDDLWPLEIEPFVNGDTAPVVVVMVRAEKSGEPVRVQPFVVFVRRGFRK